MDTLDTTLEVKSTSQFRPSMMDEDHRSIMETTMPTVQGEEQEQEQEERAIAITRGGRTTTFYSDGVIVREDDDDSDYVSPAYYTFHELNEIIVAVVDPTSHRNEPARRERYSVDLRKYVLDRVATLGSVASAARESSVSTSTVYKWIRQARELREEMSYLYTRSHIEWDFFRNFPLPHGVDGVRRRKLVFVEEFGIGIKRFTYVKEHAYQFAVRLFKPGQYTENTLMTAFVGMEAGDPTLPPQEWGSIQRPRLWTRVRRFTDTDEMDVATFCDKICAHFEKYSTPNGCDNDRIFVVDDMDWHSSSPLVYQTVEHRDTPNKFKLMKQPRVRPHRMPAEVLMREVALEVQRRAMYDWDLERFNAEFDQVFPTAVRGGIACQIVRQCGFHCD